MRSLPRCHGWGRVDVVAHVIAGWHEMLRGLFLNTADAPTVDAASFWTKFAAGEADNDPVEVLTAQRRRGSAYARPEAARVQLRDLAAVLQGGLATTADGRCGWYGQVFTVGDYLATWAVENVIHHLDLLLDPPPGGDSLVLTRETIEALTGRALPSEWDDAHAVLIGSGRVPVPGDAGGLDEVLPVLG